MQLVPFHVYTYTRKIASLASSACIWSKYYDNRTRTFQKKKALKYIYGLNEFLSKIVCGYFVRPAFNMVNCNSYLTCVVPSPHFNTLSVSVKKWAKGKGVGGGRDSDLVPRSQRTAFKQTSTIWRLAHCLILLVEKPCQDFTLRLLSVDGNFSWKNNHYFYWKLSPCQLPRFNRFHIVQANN